MSAYLAGPLAAILTVLAEPLISIASSATRPVVRILPSPWPSSTAEARGVRMEAPPIGVASMPPAPAVSDAISPCTTTRIRGQNQIAVQA